MDFWIHIGIRKHVFIGLRSNEGFMNAPSYQKGGMRPTIRTFPLRGFIPVPLRGFLILLCG